MRDTVNPAFENEYQGVRISLSKVMENDELFEIYGNDYYTSVRFGLFAAEDITAADGTVIPADGLISEVSLDEDMTDENGYFKTKEYVCGNYTVQEISPSEGYLLDKTVYSVGAEAENYFIEHNPLSMTVTEDVIKGNIAMIKHSDDGSTQIETPEVGAEFEVYLKSSGSYANAVETERDYLTCDENGFVTSTVNFLRIFLNVLVVVASAVRVAV